MQKSRKKKCVGLVQMGRIEQRFHAAESRDHACMGYAEAKKRSHEMQRFHAAESRDHACMGYAEAEKRSHEMQCLACGCWSKSGE